MCVVSVWHVPAGEMVVMDNYRVLHGRLAYEDTEGERHISRILAVQMRASVTFQVGAS